jgi:hypothetical protein
MSLNASVRRARLRLEHLEDRCTPSALLGDPWVQQLAHHRRPHAAAVGRMAANDSHAVPITVSLQCKADTSSMEVSSSGFANVLGYWTGQGNIDNIETDPVSNRIVISGTTTIVTANHDKLFVSFSTAWQPSTAQAEETVTFTGGTGKYTGASGSVSLVCRVTVDQTSPLILECDAKGTGTLILAHR